LGILQQVLPTVTGEFLYKLMASAKFTSRRCFFATINFNIKIASGFSRASASISEMARQRWDTSIQSVMSAQPTATLLIIFFAF
jgi:hypothetical protein